MQVDGINLLRIPSKDAYAYARTLLDTLFTKQEQKKSIVLKSKKSLKPQLSPQRVQKLFGKSMSLQTCSYLQSCFTNNIMPSQTVLNEDMDMTFHTRIWWLPSTKSAGMQNQTFDEQKGTSNIKLSHVPFFFSIMAILKFFFPLCIHVLLLKSKGNCENSTWISC